MKTAEEVVRAILPGWTLPERNAHYRDMVRLIEKRDHEQWQKGMTDAREIVWPSSSSRPTNNAKDTIKFNAAMAILAARDARKE